MIVIAFNASLHVGTISETAVEIDLLRRGYNVLKPSVTTRYDLIVETSGALGRPSYVRIQVKTAWLDKHGNLAVSSSEKPYSKDEIDVLAVYDRVNDNVYYVPIELLDGKTLYTLRLRPRRIKRVKSTALYANDFTSFPYEAGAS